MVRTTDKPAFDLSRDFRERAEMAERMSYRRLNLNITYHAPGFPHLLETRPHRLYDRVEIGLDDLVITRVILENPALAAFFLPYLDPHPAPQPGKGDLDALKNQARRIFNIMASSAAARESELKYLIERSDVEMGLRLDYLKDMKEQFRVDFFGRGDTDNIVRLDALPETKFLPALKQYFANWMYRPVANILNPDDAEMPLQAQAPLNEVVIALETLAEREGELQKARLFVDDCLNHGRRIIRVEEDRFQPLRP